jgi:ribonuclease VapC
LASPVVFDASAILAVLYDEPGAGKVVDFLHGALVSSVNLAEVHARLLLNGRNAVTAWNRVRSMGFEVVPFSEEQARLAGELFGNRPGNSRPPALSLGERACLALALERSATVYTANPAWQSLPIEAEVVLIA